jgi:hypothetical protein
MVKMHILKAFVISLGAAAFVNDVVPSFAQSIPQDTLVRLCALGTAANKEGWSAKPMIEKAMVNQGRPKYLANVAMKEMKPICPKVY